MNNFLPDLHSPTILPNNFSYGCTHKMQSISNFNTMFSETSRFIRNSTEVNRHHALCIAQNELGYRKMKPLTPSLPMYYFTNVLPNDFIETAKAVVASTGLAFEGCCIAVAAMVSVATWGRIDVQLEPSWHEPCVDQVVGFGLSGIRKSAGISKLVKPVEVFQDKLRNEFEGIAAKQLEKHNRLKKIKRAFDTGARKTLIGFTREEIEAVLEDCEEFERSIEGLAEKPLATPNLLLSSTTEFGLLQQLTEQGECQAAVSAEGGMLMSLFLKTGDLILKTHTKEAHSYRTGKGAYSLKNPALPMCCLSQFEVAKKLYSDDSLRQLGGTARIIPFFHFPSIPVSFDQPNSAALQEYDKKITSLLNLFFTQDPNAKRCTLSVDPGAFNAIKRFEAEVQMKIQDDEDVAPWLRKLHGQAVRFASDIHAWNNATSWCSTISEVEMLQGIELAKISIPHAGFALSPFGLRAYLDAKKIVKSLLGIGTVNEQHEILSKGTTTTAIRQRTGISTNRINNALQYIANHYLVFPYDDGTGNRRVVLHPNFFTSLNPENGNSPI